MQCKLPNCCRQITELHTVTKSTIAHTGEPVHGHRLENMHVVDPGLCTFIYRSEYIVLIAFFDSGTNCTEAGRWALVGLWLSWQC